MLLISFGAARRRSEIVALRIGDVIADERGLSLVVRHSKTDQHGRGRILAIWANRAEPEFCPLVAYERWMDIRRQTADWIPPLEAPEAPPLPTATWQDERPLFCAVTPSGQLTGTPMADKIVARLIKQACSLAGLDASRFSGHSLRRGLLTAAGDLQLPLIDLMRQSRHRSVLPPSPTSRPATPGATISPGRCSAAGRDDRRSPSPIGWCQRNCGHSSRTHWVRRPYRAELCGGNGGVGTADRRQADGTTVQMVRKTINLLSCCTNGC